MVLSSQTARSSTHRRRYTTRRRRKGSSSKWVWLVLLVAVCAGVYWLWPSGSEDSSSGTATHAQASKTPAKPVSQAEPRKQTQTPVREATPSAAPLAAGRAGDAPDRRAQAIPTPQGTAGTTATPTRQATPPQGQTPAPAALIGQTSPNESTGRASAAIAHGQQLFQQGKPLEARKILNDLLIGQAANLSVADTHAVRQILAQINQTLVFSPRAVAGDPFAEYYKVQPGDFLSTIAPRYNVPYQLIELINNVSARRIRVGQRIKVIHGPFHAVVSKSGYRMDVYLAGSGGQRVYVRSFRVGLGEDDSTPLGTWIVRRGSKLSNPGWTNPRTGKVYGSDDPANPIGEYWIGLQGIDENTKGLVGYGIHGTIEPDSVGKQVSMGCIRLKADDIDMVYKLLTDGQSTVAVGP